MTEDEEEHLLELANAYIEDELSEAQRHELDETLQKDLAARRVFADFLHDHAALFWDQVSDSKGTVVDFPVPQTGFRKVLLGGIWAAAAAIVVLAVSIATSPSPIDEPAASAFATMESTRAARWESGDLPTAEGARLGEGQLRLAEGLATLKFDSGAEVTLEAPAEIQLMDAMNCRLTRGTAVADVPESALGFRVETPSANVVDYGTRFAVNVDSASGATQTQVFDGLVEVEHPATRKVVRLETGQRNFVAGDSFSQASMGPEEGEWSAPVPQVQRGPDWIPVPTTRDAYVHSVEIKDHTSEVLLLVKNSSFNGGPSRKAYLGFDLSGMDLAAIKDAELVLHFSPTGWGLASNVLDAKFLVYGIIDSSLNDWNESAMTWKNAPANVPSDGDALVQGSVQSLGFFTVEQGVQRGTFGIQGSALADFLQNRPDSFATLIVVRETEEFEGGGLVHGFASRRHPVLPAPTLLIRIAPDDSE